MASNGNLSNADFSEIKRIFRSGPIPKERLSYKIIGAMLKSLEKCGEMNDYLTLHDQCTCSVFDIGEFHIHRSSKIRETEVLFSEIIPAMADSRRIHLKLCEHFPKLPNGLTEALKIVPLAGVNLAALEEQPVASESSNQITSRKWYMAWGNLSNQRNDSFVLLLNSETNEMHAYPSPQGSAYENILNIFTHTFPVHAWGSSKVRNHFLQKTLPAVKISHAPMPCPFHYGHYVQNNLAHVSRLEEVGLTHYFDTIYRPHDRSDFLEPSEEVHFFNEDTRCKLKYISSLEDAIQESHDKKDELLIISKAATLSSYTSRVFRRSLSKHPVAAYNMKSMASELPIRLCIGLRGGTREALNLVDVIERIVKILYQDTGRQVALLADGMSQSNLNDRDTTRLLSIDAEHQQAKHLSSLCSLEVVASVDSVVGKPMFEQLQQIIQCHAAISHFGSSFFKYMTMCGIPTIVHGERPSFYDKYAGEATPNYFIGPEYISELIPYVDPKRNSYYLSIEKSATEISRIIVSLLQ